MLKFTGERIVPEADNCEPHFARRMYQEHIARYMFAAQLCEGRRVLDLGCGIGYGSQFLAQKGAARVVAVDLAEDAIEHGRKFYSHPNLEFRQGDAQTFVIDEQFDMVTCFEVIEHVHDQRAVMETIRKALRPGGVMVMSTPRPYAEMRSEFHVHELEEDEFRELIGQVFRNQEYYFENMHFCSIVADRALDRIEVIKYLDPDLALSNCDVLMVVASDEAIERDRLRGVLVVNDDRYVTLLETDVRTLRAYDAQWRQNIEDLEALLAEANEKHDKLFLGSVPRGEYEALVGSTVSREAYEALERSKSEAYAALEQSSREAYEALDRSKTEAWLAQERSGREAYQALERSCREAYEALEQSSREAYLALDRSHREAYEALQGSTVSREAYEALERSSRDAYRALEQSSREAYEALVRSTVSQEDYDSLALAAQNRSESLRLAYIRLQSDTAHLKDEEARLTAERDRLRIEFEALGRLADDLLAQVHDAAIRIRQMEMSTSWRITGPLRRLKALLSGKMG